MTTQEHVSTFELDVYFVSPAQDRSEIADHVASCARCAAYLDALAALDGDDAVRLPPPRPAQPSERRAIVRLRRFIAPATGALALAAAVAIYVRTQPPAEDAAYIGVKGGPSVQVLVRSSAQTGVWDGHSALRAGDAIALQIACEQLEHVTVTTEDDARLVRLWDGPCPKPPSPLPFTLVVDDQPGHERFAVVLGRTRMDDHVLRDAVRTQTRSSDVWVTTLELPKEARR